MKLSHKHQKIILSIIIALISFFVIYTLFPTIIKFLNEFVIPITSTATFVLIIIHRIEDTEQKLQDKALQYRPLLEFEYVNSFNEKEDTLRFSKFNNAISVKIPTYQPTKPEDIDRVDKYVNDKSKKSYDMIPLCIKNIGNGNAMNPIVKITCESFTVDDTKWKLFEPLDTHHNIPILISQKSYIIKQEFSRILNIPNLSVLQRMQNDDFSFNIIITIQYTDEFNVFKYTSTFEETIGFKSGCNTSELIDLEYTVKNVRLVSLNIEKISNES